MKWFVLVLMVFVFGIAAVGCKDNAKDKQKAIMEPERIITQQSVKTEILGLKLCEKTYEGMVEEALEDTIGDYVIVEGQRDGVGKIIRAVPVSMSFSFGGSAWMYIDIHLDREDNIVMIELTASYENIENAKRQYEQVMATFERKYGKGNVHPEGQLMFWTDDVNSVGVNYQESAAINGEVRSFCTLYYTNIALFDKLQEQNVSDI